MKTNKILLAALGVALAGMSMTASATLKTGNISPSITITAACSISTVGFSAVFAPVASGIAMTDYTTATSDISVACPNTAYTFGARQGAHWDATNKTRQLLGAVTTNLIPYTLSITAATNGSGTTLNWGDDTMTGTNTDVSMPPVTMPATNPNAVDLWAVIAHLDLAGTELDDTYSDTVQVVVEY